MKLKKTISIVLSTVMVTNLACSYIASAHPETKDIPSTVTVTEKEMPSTSSFRMDEGRDGQESDRNFVTYREDYDNDHMRHSYRKKELIDRFLTQNSKYLPKSKMRDLSAKLHRLSCDDIHKLNSVSLDNPSHMTIISIFFGNMGLDRLLIGKIGTGILKFLTAGGFGIWWIYDIFKIGELTREQNWEKLKQEINEL
ncbi:MAG: TM2 domain-containing protein [Clostridia bacterium]|nr:TM2 domain-containing protein [Clostridia bacterium]